MKCNKGITNMKKTILIQTLMLGLLAGFNVSAKEVDTNSSISITSSGVVSEVGKVNQDLLKSNLSGFAKDLPLLSVLKQITPNGWIVKKTGLKEEAVDVNMPVSWQGGKNWLETLKDISANHKLNFLVNWDKKTITVMKPQASQLKEEPKVETKSAVFEVDSAPTAAVSGDKVTPEVVKQTWRTYGGKSLKYAVAEWAKKANHKLVWMGKDYPVDRDEIYEGDFDSEDGPIKQLSIDYGPESRVETPLSFELTANGYLIVENLMFEQSGAPQYIKESKGNK